MAIKSNKKIDFEYEFESGESVFSIWLRLYEAADVGMSIGVLDEEGEIAISFPISMFSEVTDFLVSQGVIETKKSLSSALPVQKTIPSKQGILPKPRIVSSKPSFKSKPIVKPTVVDLENDNQDDLSEYPEEVRDRILEEQERLNSIHNAVEGSVPAMSLSSNAEQQDLPEEEAKNILQERQSAMQKAKNSIKKIKRKEDE